MATTAAPPHLCLSGNKGWSDWEEFSGGEKPFRHVCSAKRKRQTPTPHRHTDIKANNNDKTAEILTCTPAQQARHGELKKENLLMVTNIYGTEIRQTRGLAKPVFPNFQQQACTISRMRALCFGTHPEGRTASQVNL